MNNRDFILQKNFLSIDSESTFAANYFSCLNQIPIKELYFGCLAVVF
jgi:hypothetical protein